MTLTTDAGDPLPVADFQSFTVKAFNQGKLTNTWQWLPDFAGSEYITLVDGLAQLEVQTTVTAMWLGTINFQVLPAFIDTDYFVEGAQTDVVCFNNLLRIIQC